MIDHTLTVISITEDLRSASKTPETELGREQMLAEKEWLIKSTIELKTQNRLALKDLSWVNDKVLKAQDLIKELDLQIADKKKELALFVSLGKQVPELEELKKQVLLDIDLTRKNAEAYLLELRKEVESLLELRDAH